MNTSKKRILRISICVLALALTVGWLCFIFSNSMQDASASSGQSGKVHETVNKIAQSVGIEKPISESTVRKSAHFTEFAVLSMLLCLDLVAFGAIKLSHVSALLSLSAIPVCALLAMIDEYIQSVAPGRATEWRDILIDTAGAATAVALFLGAYLILCFILQHIRKKKQRC